MHQVFLYANCNRSLAYTAVSHENWSNGKMCCLRQTSVKSQRSVFDRWKHLMYSQRYSSSTLKVVQMENQSVRLSRRSDHDSWLIFNVDDFINAKIFFYYYYYYYLHSLLWHCWLGVRKSIRPVKIEWWGGGVVMCLERGADCLHVVQLIPLPSPNPIIFCLI